MTLSINSKPEEVLEAILNLEDLSQDWYSNDDYIYCSEELSKTLRKNNPEFNLYNWLQKNSIDCVETEVDIDKHRWEEYSGSTFKFGERYLHVYGVSQIYSDGMGCSDIDGTINFSEVYPHTVTTTVYKNTPP